MISQGDVTYWTEENERTLGGAGGMGAGHGWTAGKYQVERLCIVSSTACSAAAAAACRRSYVDWIQSAMYHYSDLTYQMDFT